MNNIKDILSTNNIKDTLSINNIKDTLSTNNIKKKIKNFKDTLSYYYINPNILYLKKNFNSYYNKTKYDFNSYPGILNPINFPLSHNKIKKNQYDIIQPYNISLSNNYNYEFKLKIGYIICIIIVAFYLILYINQD